MSGKGVSEGLQQAYRQERKAGKTIPQFHRLPIKYLAKFIALAKLDASLTQSRGPVIEGFQLGSPSSIAGGRFRRLVALGKHPEQKAARSITATYLATSLSYRRSYPRHKDENKFLARATLSTLLVFGRAKDCKADNYCKSCR